jgi:hypothetical protein
MRKILFILALFVVGSTAYSQAVFQMGAINIDSVYFDETNGWVTGVVIDTTLTTTSDKTLPSSQAIKTYVLNTAESVAASVVSDSLAGFVSVESDPIFAADSANLLHWADTTSTIATQYDLSNIDVGDWTTTDTTLSTTKDVGIGIAPVYLFHAQKSIAADVIGLFSNTSATGYGVVFKNGNDNNYSLSVQNTAGTNNIQMFGNGNLTLLGNIGIGTHSPATITHIYGASPAIRIQNTDDGNGSQDFKAITGGLTITSDAGNSFFVERTTGDIGIGTTSPSEALDVDGTVAIRDSVYLTIFGDMSSSWLTGTSTSAIDTATTEPASFIFEMNKIRTATQRLEEMLNYEVRWYYQVDGTIYNTFMVDKLPPMRYLQALQAGIEYNLRNIADVEKKQAELEARIEALERATPIKKKRFKLFRK